LLAFGEELPRTAAIVWKFEDAVQDRFDSLLCGFGFGSERSHQRIVVFGDHVSAAESWGKNEYTLVPFEAFAAGITIQYISMNRDQALSRAFEVR
jgi:hypothetical protein